MYKFPLIIKKNNLTYSLSSLKPPLERCIKIAVSLKHSRTRQNKITIEIKRTTQVTFFVAMPLL